jgi:hypothetical protein
MALAGLVHENDSFVVIKEKFIVVLVGSGGVDD